MVGVAREGIHRLVHYFQMYHYVHTTVNTTWQSMICRNSQPLLVFVDNNANTLICLYIIHILSLKIWEGGTLVINQDVTHEKLLPSEW